MDTQYTHDDLRLSTQCQTNLKTVNDTDLTLAQGFHRAALWQKESFSVSQQSKAKQAKFRKENKYNDDTHTTSKILHTSTPEKWGKKRSLERESDQHVDTGKKQREGENRIE